MKPSFYYPAKPYTISQKWGLYRPEVYSRFGFSCHNGEDFALGKDKTIRPPFEGEVIKIGNQFNGGGVFLGFISKEEFEFEDGIKCRVLFDALHLEKVLVQEGQKCVPGDILAIADNTGFSTGPHTHGQWRRVNWDGIRIIDADKNNANNSFDPTKFWNGMYSQDYASIVNNLNQQSILLKKVLLLLTSLLKIK